MIQFFGQMLKLPLEAFVFSMEMLVKTIQGMQKIAYQGIDAMVSEIVQPLDDLSDGESDPTSDVPDGTIGDSAETAQQTTQQEEREMAEKDLRDDMLKLVRYKVLFVKRDYEWAFPEKEELVSENTDAAGYTAWKIAEFIQDLPKTQIPEKWRSKKYPPAELESPPSRDPGMIHALPEDDKKYLRVYYEVLERYPRERFKYEERQIEVLEQIRDKMKDP
jgi:hypothetical protein